MSQMSTGMKIAVLGVAALGTAGALIAIKKMNEKTEKTESKSGRVPDGEVKSCCGGHGAGAEAKRDRSKFLHYREEFTRAFVCLFFSVCFFFSHNHTQSHTQVPKPNRCTLI